MNRRQFLSSATATTVSLSVPGAGIAQTEQCRVFSHPQFGQVQQCGVGLKLNNTPRQECKYWCWAACSEAIFGMAGYNIDQKQFVQKVFGGNTSCSTATGPMIKAGIDGVWVDKSGQEFGANLGIVMDTQFGIAHSDPVSVIYKELNAGRALITGTLGHAVVITAMEYFRTPVGPQIQSVIVRDPWPRSPNKRILSQQEFFSANFLATLRTYDT